MYLSSHILDEALWASKKLTGGSKTMVRVNFPASKCENNMQCLNGIRIISIIMKITLILSIECVITHDVHILLIPFPYVEAQAINPTQNRARVRDPGWLLRPLLRRGSGLCHKIESEHATCMNISRNGAFQRMFVF